MTPTLPSTSTGPTAPAMPVTAAATEAGTGQSAPLSKGQAFDQHLAQARQQRKGATEEAQPDQEVAAGPNKAPILLSTPLDTMAVAPSVEPPLAGDNKVGEKKTTHADTAEPSLAGDGAVAALIQGVVSAGSGLRATPAITIPPRANQAALSSAPARALPPAALAEPGVAALPATGATPTPAGTVTTGFAQTLAAMAPTPAEAEGEAPLVSAALSVALRGLTGRPTMGPTSSATGQATTPTRGGQHPDASLQVNPSIAALKGDGAVATKGGHDAEGVILDRGAATVPDTAGSHATPGGETFSAWMTQANAPAANAPATPVPTLNLATPLHDPDFGHDFGRQITWLGLQDVKQARIELNPKDMGPIEVNITVQHTQVDVSFAVQHPAAQQAVQQSLPQLQTLLAQQGLNLGQASVGQQQQSRSNEGRGQQGQGDRNERATEINSVEGPQMITRRTVGLLDTFA